MTKRDNHYEVALEAYLRARQIPYVAVDETKRSRLGGGSLKSLDFIISPARFPGSLLVDVKGRRFPAGRQHQLWKNWSTHDDLRSLAHWQALFGTGSQAILVFAYHIVGELAPLPANELFAHRGQLYAFIGIRLDHYTSWARTISPKWQTVAMPVDRFRALARPLHEFIALTPASAAKTSIPEISDDNVTRVAS